MHAIGAVALAVFLVVVGIAHFALPGYFRTLVPSWLPGPGLLVAVSGAAEIVIGGLILFPATRATGGWAAAALISGYVVTWLDILHTARAGSPSLLRRRPAAFAAVVVNVGYVAWALFVATGG
ncbi:hypothetical protein HII36_49250 [Nonomuraea sp. NN258]|uniref:hypothetical protein n=1 Tax=Nonomuraea antri TaxID=2730852 RepID=UPI001567F571|nr:hypothetical protein [Nonomuraea antri]NRQ39767.1 hypothetical protein [Nonomuraea antri]